MTELTARQEDAVREATHLGAAQAATMLAKLLGEGAVWVDVPQVVRASRSHLVSLLGGRETRVVAVRFGVEGPLPGELWWVLPKDDAKRLGQRLVTRPSFNGLTFNLGQAVREAANIVASACLSSVGTLVHAPLLPSPPEVIDGPTEAVVAQAPPLAGQVTFASSHFLSGTGPFFRGVLVWAMNDAVRDDLLRRLAVA